MKNVAKRTSCQAPCTYTEYRLRADTKKVVSMGQTVEKPRRRPEKTVSREFPRAQPEGTPDGPFFPGCPESFSRLVRLC